MHPTTPSQRLTQTANTPLRADFSPESSQLDTQVKSVLEQHQDAPDQQWRFRGCRETREKLLRVLPHCEYSDKRLRSFRNCGTQAWIQYSPSTDKVRVRALTCRLRYCPACRRKYAYALAERITTAMQQRPRDPPSLITLTLKNSTQPLSDQLTRIKMCFRMLRQSELWKRTVQHGIAIIEVTRGQDGTAWHPHLHIIAWAKYISRFELSRLWRNCTHNSYIVDVRRTKDTRRVAHYVSSYLTKPPSDAILDDLHLAREWIEALKRHHWVIRFGKRGQIPPATRNDDPKDWIDIAPLTLTLQRQGERSLIDAARTVIAEELHERLIGETSP